MRFYGKFERSTRHGGVTSHCISFVATRSSVVNLFLNCIFYVKKNVGHSHTTVFCSKLVDVFVVVRDI